MSADSWPDRRFTAERGPRNPISRAGFEVIAGRSIAIFGLIFGAQTVSALLAQVPFMTPRWGIVAAIAVFGSLVLVAVAAIVQFGVKTAMGLSALIYLAVVALWPLLVHSPVFEGGNKPWVWYLCTVATAFATVAFPLWLATVYTVVAPVVYGVARALPAGGGVGPELALLDVIYAVILGGAILVIVTMLRQAASGVDAAQSTALEKYSTAVREHAMEVERVQVDAIVHDSVLTTLLAAAGASSADDQSRAARMASDAIGHLHSAVAVDPDDQTLVDLGRLTRRVRAAASAFSNAFEIRTSRVEGQTLPVHVAEALYSASVQAMVNSMQHAGGAEVTRTLSIEGGRDGDPVTVTVTDDGAGFDPDAVPTERLGLRVSIGERVVNVGGAVEVRSHPGDGASIVLTWPAAEVRA
ncbi:ATP-binding protein [Microbacterium sp. STN6]|uniref:sensor histidine kinase n=1 Tax=Microbacterium sp. STN6 TaxID=2995588 RepID=UPI002260DFBA|nr:ATP-binding protein [Microbacterium sp. STN6]MCX7520988.1 ATP-binding protein [Microbacterium sp. STN6]